MWERGQTPKYLLIKGANIYVGPEGLNKLVRGIIISPEIDKGKCDYMVEAKYGLRV